MNTNKKAITAWRTSGTDSFMRIKDAAKVKERHVSLTKELWQAKDQTDVY